MSKAQSASAVFPMVEFAKRFTPNVKDPLRECCEFLAKLKINPTDAGVIKDSSGGLVWFTNEGMAKLNLYLQKQAPASVLKQVSIVIPSRQSSSSTANTRSTHKPNAYFKLNLERSAIKIQRAWRKYSALKNHKKRPALKVGRTARLAIKTVDYISNLSKIYKETLPNQNKEKDLAFIKLLNSDDTFQASVGLATDSLTASSNKSGSTFIYQKVSQNFIKWLNEVLDTKYQTSANVIDILKTGTVLCQLILLFFPSTDCQLLNKGVKFSIHKIIFFLEFCRFNGVNEGFALSDLVPSLIQDESSSGIAVLRTISSLESKSKIAGNWNGPYFELYETLKEVYGISKEERQDNSDVTDRKGSPIMGNINVENLDSTQNKPKFPNEILTGASIKGRLARLREKRADRVLSATIQAKVSGPESPELSPKAYLTSHNIEWSSRQQKPINGDSSSPKREMARSSDEYFVKSQELDRNETRENIFSGENVQKPQKELPVAPIKSEVLKKDTKPVNANHEAPKTSKLLSSIMKRIDAKDNSQPINVRDSEAVRTGKDISSTRSGLRNGASSKDRDSLNSNDTNLSQLSFESRHSSTSGQLGVSELEEVVWKIAASERKFGTIMVNIVEFLDILARQKQIEIDRLGIPVEQTSGDEDSESYDTYMELLINNERQENETDSAYSKRLQNELEELSQSREITLSIISLHKRLFTMMTEYLQEMKSQKTTHERGHLGKMFLSFAADMLNPYVRYSVFFFNNDTSSGDFRPPDREDFQKTVDFITTYIKVEDAKRPYINREDWVFFLKFPLQRLYNYSEFLDDVIIKSNRDPSDIDNRKLRIAKLKILAAVDTIRERFE